MSYTCLNFGKTSSKMILDGPYRYSNNYLLFNDYKSERLAKKEVKKIVTFLFSRQGINPAWILDDKVWQNQVEYEDLIYRRFSNPYVCGCQSCCEEENAELRASRAKFPKRSLTKENVEPLFIALCAVMSQCRQTTMLVHLYTVLYRFAYGPGRVLLKSKNFCTRMRNLIYMVDLLDDDKEELNESEEKLCDAERNLEFLLDTNDDIDGYSIFYQ